MIRCSFILFNFITITDYPANAKPNVFTKILRCIKDGNDELQLELHFRSTKYHRRFTILLNNMRVMGIFDWLLAVKQFITSDVADERGHYYLFVNINILYSI